MDTWRPKLTAISSNKTGIVTATLEQADLPNVSVRLNSFEPFWMFDL